MSEDILRGVEPQFATWDELCRYIETTFHFDKPAYYWVYMGESACMVVGARRAGMLYEKWLIENRKEWNEIRWQGQ